ncbi:outer membrane beta-barrel protein [uncultured Lacinutrix sp.]|uniref:outer membrane beta-barrel protein n=1 Tax=uncultured Lacinutrix sp. TaxID=574032 RepID=UPI002612D438|nr:outer membrane beta-barrel protein [uncultured Lacinutrix sp.]
MRKLLLLASLLFATVSFSQTKEFKVIGKLIAANDQSPLEAATVYMQRVKDSTLVTYTISDKNGVFSLEDTTSDEYLNFYISYVGYKTYLQKLKIDKEIIDLETILLEEDSNTLDEVIIKSTAPVTIKQDTLEFNVKSFKTKKDANVEDLLKQLPGVEIDEEGKIKVNGKEVNKILVNGKPFFGNDPSITTKNLTKDIVEKIQIVDTKTKAEAFTGEAGSKENKTINLTIKEENNKGVFGRVAAGGGTDERYEFAGMLNVFDNDQRISVLAGGNNTNSPGFSFGEISKMFGRGGGMNFGGNGSFTIGGRSFGGGQGITTSKNAGLNYADKIGETTEVSSDYFYASSSSVNESSSQRETILSDSRFFTNSNSRSDNDTDSHTANLEFEIETDSTFQINIVPSFSYSKTRTIFGREDETLNEERVLTNQSSTDSDVERLAKQFSNQLTLTKRFGAKGAFVRFELENRINRDESDDFINSNTEIFGASPETIIRNQFTDGENNSNGLTAEFTYRLPIVAKKLFLNFEYEYSRDKDENRESTFDFDDISQSFSIFNTDLSTDFEYTDSRSIPGVGLTYRGKKWSTRFNASYNIRTLKNEDLLRPQFNVERDFKNLQLRYNIDYRFSEKESIYMGYRLNNNPPALRQLQAYTDVSNPLNTIIGNPNLEPSNTHRLYVGYNSFDWQKRTGMYVNVSANVNNNQVISKTVVEPETLKRTTTYENVNGNYNFNASGNYSKNFKLDSLRNIKLRVGAWSSFSKNINFNNDIKYSSTVSAITPNVGLDFIWKNTFEFKPYYRITFTNNAFDIDAFQDREFTRHSAGIKTATFLPKKLEWRNDISFNYNPDVAEGFQKSAWFWNATLAYSVLKDKGAVTLKVYDLLNQNTNARRTATQDYIEDSQSTVLQQYFMLSFSWKFNSLGSKGESSKNSFHIFN